MKDYSRSERVASQLHRELAQLIRSEVRDPQVGAVSITEVEVSRDLSHAKIYVLCFEEEQIDISVAALNRAAVFLRGRLGRELRMRIVPDLKFLHDTSVAQGERIDQLLAQVRDQE